MNSAIKLTTLFTGCLLLISSCAVPSLVQKNKAIAVPAAFHESNDTSNSATINWRSYFTDPYLIALIDTALKNNQEMNSLRQEVLISGTEIRARKGEYLPYLGVGGGGGFDKHGRYTNIGAMEANTEIAPGKEMPEPVTDMSIAFRAGWELDIWKKLRNAKNAAVERYQGSVEAQHFFTTRLIAEIANAYYELLALDNQLINIRQNLDIQQNALNIVKMEKNAAMATELAVRKFEAEVLKNQSQQYVILQQIAVTENEINFLVGRLPQPIQRNAQLFSELVPTLVHVGIPSQLLENRPDVRQAERELHAAKLDVKVSKANFYPAAKIVSGIGFQAFNPAYFIRSPESMLYSLGGEIIAPLINRNAIKAQYFAANYKQVQAMYHYEQCIIKAYTEVLNQVSNISNLDKYYDLKSKQVNALTESIGISTSLFKSARADYMEVLMTQRDALEARFELIEARKQQMNAVVNIYQALGGGWQ